MTLALVVPPVGPVVDLPLIKQHLRIDGAEQDLLLQSYERAAVAYLDGRTGVLGRAILAQTWAEEFEGWGEYRLAMPDAVLTSMTYRDFNGVMQAFVGASSAKDGSATVISADGPATDLVRVQYQCSMSLAQRSAAEVIVLLMVANWFRSPEGAVIGASVAELPFAVRNLITALQWRRV